MENLDEPTGVGDKRLLGEDGHPFPAWLAFHLNNPLRRHFHPPEKTVSVLGVKGTDAVLDFGCGPGFYTIPFAKIAREVIAVDIQPKMLEKVARYAEKNRVKIKSLQSDGQLIPLPDNSFDLVFLSGVYHHLTDKRRVLTELTRLLKSGGRIVIRERTEPGSIILGPPSVDKEEVFTDLKAVGLVSLETTPDPCDKRTMLMTAIAE